MIYKIWSLTNPIEVTIKTEGNNNSDQMQKGDRSHWCEKEKKVYKARINKRVFGKRFSSVSIPAHNNSLFNNKNLNI